MPAVSSQAFDVCIVITAEVQPTGLGASGENRFADATVGLERPATTLELGQRDVPRAS